MHLQANRIARIIKTGDVDALVRAGTNVCMECGSCAFSCPAGRPLVQHMRLAKSMIREAAKANGK